jgi:hypothetical protein
MKKILFLLPIVLIGIEVVKAAIIEPKIEVKRS